MKTKHPNDRFFENKVLSEAVSDLKDYFGIDNLRTDIPIMETWLKVWRHDFNFRDFIKKKMKQFNRNRKRRYIIVHKTRKVNATLHLKLTKEIKKKKRKKIRSKIKGRG